MTEQEMEAIADKFIQVGNPNPEACVHKILHYQRTGGGLKCNECSRSKCAFNVNPCVRKEK